MTDDFSIPPDELPIVSNDDILAVLPAFMRQSDNAPIRDAIVAALEVMFETYQEAATWAAQQSDILTATGTSLVSKLEERGIFQNPGESDDELRLRGLGLRAVVTPAAICAAVNSLIAPLSCSYLEPELDQVFFEDGDATWASFIDVAPQYQDRLYPDDAASNGGVVKANVNPPPAGFFDTDAGRYFQLLAPDISQLDDALVLAYDGEKLAPGDVDVPEMGGALLDVPIFDGEGVSAAYGGTGLYPMDTVADGDARLYLFDNTTGANAIYSQIVQVVERLRGGGFRWSLMTAPA